MTYQILDYNMNEPSTKRITVPLRSNYGVGIRVSENGHALSVDPSQIAVNGISATTKMFDVCLCDLSSGTEPCQKAYDVTVNGQPAPTQIHATRIGYMNNTDQPAEDVPFAAQLLFPRDFKFPAEIKANATNGYFRVTLSSAIETVVVDELAHIDQGDGRECAFDGEKWVDYFEGTSLGDTLSLSSNFSITTTATIPAYTDAKTNYTLEVENERNASDAKFKLVVNEGDLGYFEI